MTRVGRPTQSPGPAGSLPAVTAISVRPISGADRQAVLDIARELVRSSDTHAFDPNVSDDDLWQYWSSDSMARGFVVESPSLIRGELSEDESDRLKGPEDDGDVDDDDHDEVLAVFVIKPNHPGPASHVANASCAVRADMRGLGVGRRIGEESIRLANGRLVAHYVMYRNL